MRTGVPCLHDPRRLSVADDMDVQVSVHTDTLNESGYVEDTIDAIAGRVIPHLPIRKARGGGHAPDILRVASHPNVLPSSNEPDAAVRHQHTVGTVRHDHGLP